ncbi:MAG TPA: hypothetical protein DDZ81_19060 [Acetobacteraceae bacterium]|nr:hypothetical protein [Acetobacteraceae bacterium]
MARRCSGSRFVTAPFAGRVAGVAVHAFQFVPPGAPMPEILSDHDLELEMIISSRWQTWLKPGAAFGVAIDETRKTYPAERAVNSLGETFPPVAVVTMGGYAVVQANAGQWTLNGRADRRLPRV